MSVINQNLLLTPEGYQISRSVRLRSSASAYFNRTASTPTSGTTWTWSGWIKRGALGSNLALFGGGSNSTTTYDGLIYSASTDTLNLFTANGVNLNLVTTQVFRDPSAWYHVVAQYDSTQATAANRAKLYINGVQVTAFGTSTYPAQNTISAGINANGIVQVLGAVRTTLVSLPFDGYLTEVNFIDGQALTPSSFGETDAVTGVWKPKKYAGTYGTNGFYLNFSDNSAATAAAIGKDWSGNGNNWTPNNISVTAGVTYDSMLDVPTMYADGGNGRGNYAVMSPINASTSGLASGGNLDISIGSGVAGLAATMSVTSGKWYWEFIAGTSSTSSYYVSICDTDKWSGPSQTQTTMYNSANVWSYYGTSGQKINAGSVASYGATFTSGDVIGVALDMDAGTVTFYKNNTSQGQAFSGLTGKTIAPWIGNGASGNSAAGSINFGQRPFAYTPPTGFKALNTQNLPDATIKKGNKYFDATTYTGNGSTQSIVNSGAMQPDLVWIKGRSVAYSSQLFDAVRGVGSNKELTSDQTYAEGGGSSGAFGFVSSLNSNGFTLAAGSTNSNQNNQNAATYVGWQWKESASAGFDIVTYTGTGANTTVAHSLGVAPKMLIVKSRNGTNKSWNVWHASLAATDYLYLEQTVAKGTDATKWNSTAPSSTVFSLGSAGGTNASGENFVAYLFAEVAGFSKFGSYTGNGSADGPFVYCGFRPRFILLKRTDSIGNWNMFDSARNGYNQTNPLLFANTYDAEYTTAGAFEYDILSNGFKVRNTGTGVNASGATVIFAAFAENPFRYSLAR